MHDILLDNIQKVSVRDPQERLLNEFLTVEVLQTVFAVKLRLFLTEPQFVDVVRHVEHSFD
jgi:hypothetical protein